MPLRTTFEKNRQNPGPESESEVHSSELGGLQCRFRFLSGGLVSGLGIRNKKVSGL